MTLYSCIYLKARYRPTFTLYYIWDQPVMLANMMEVLCQLQLHKNRQSKLQKCTFIACCNCWSTRKHLQPISVKHIYQEQFVCHPFTVHDSKLKYKCFKTARENKTVPECQWKKDWPHLPLTSPPGSSHSCHPSPLPGPALSSATKQNTLHTTCLLQSFTFLQLKQILILTTLHLLPIPTSHPSLPPQLSEAEGALTFNCSDWFVKWVRGLPYMSMLGWGVEPRIVGRQAGSLTRIRCVSTQRRPPASSIHGTLLPGLAVYIAGIAEGRAVEQQKKTTVRQL